MGTAPWQPDSSAVRKKMRKKRRRNQPLLDVSDASSGTLSETEELSAAPSHEEAVADNPTLKGLRYRRERAGSCWCGKIGGCACLDGCCFEDTPGVEECPCRVANYVPDNNLVAGDPAPCELCLEDGVRRPCCKHGFCRYCYEKSGNCPGCNRISVGADAGLFWEDVEKRGRGEVRDGEECRLCLRQGFCRKCCSEFYCSACYFKEGYCPSCRQPTEQKPAYQKEPPDPGVRSVLLGYMISLLVCISMLIIFAVIVANDRSLPATIFGFRCYGFFPTCSEEQTCVEYQGSMNDALPNPLMDWTACTTESVKKLYGTFCVYDEQVYVRSGQRWGYDMCESEFPGVVTVFQDTFDVWSGRGVETSSMASGRWANIVNGEAGTECGVGGNSNVAASPRGNKAALYFSGSDIRSAETEDVDLRNGGQLRFWMKMGPDVIDPDEVTCKPARGGHVTLSFSTDEGSSWTELRLLETFTFRKFEFTLVEIDIAADSSAATPATRFLFEQHDFVNALEHWALDDVQVQASLAPDWKERNGFSLLKEDAHQSMREARCCLNSEQCEAPKAEQEGYDCSIYTGSDSNERALLGAELFVVLSGVVLLVRAVYRLGQGVVLQGWDTLIPQVFRKHRAKIFMADDPIAGAADGQYALVVGRQWQLTFMALTVGPAVIVWVWCAALLQNFYLLEELAIGADFSHPWYITLRVHVSFIFILASFLDALHLLEVARDVVCLLPMWVPRIDLDLRQSAGWLQIGTRRFKLDRIKSQRTIDAAECRWIAAAYITGAWPWCLLALVAKYSYLSYSVSRYITNLSGILIILRSWLGAGWVIKMAYYLRWLVTVDMYNRDEIGNAVTNPKTRYMMLYCTVAGSLAAVFVTMLVNVALIWAAALAAAAACALYGLMLSVVQGLPVTPSFLLTTISKGVVLRLYKEADCPCVSHMKSCSSLHSRDELVSLFVKDSLTFAEMLKGDSSIAA